MPTSLDAHLEAARMSLLDAIASIAAQRRMLALATDFVGGP